MNPTPYRVHRVISDWDAAGSRPGKADPDRYGRAIPDEEYQTKDFERSLALRARTVHGLAVDMILQELRRESPPERNLITTKHEGL